MAFTISTLPNISIDNIIDILAEYYKFDKQVAAQCVSEALVKDIDKSYNTEQGVTNSGKANEMTDKTSEARTVSNFEATLNPKPKKNESPQCTLNLLHHTQPQYSGFKGKWRDTLNRIFNDKRFEIAYSFLLNRSETLGSRNGKKGMEIGRFREDDLVAALHYVGGCSINNKIPNSEIPDVVVESTYFSIKHKSVKYGDWNATGIKANWTVDRDSVNRSVGKLEKHNSFGIIISLVSQSETRIYITGPERYSKIIQELGDGAFKRPKENTNARGVEYSKTAAQRFLTDCDIIKKVPCKLETKCSILSRIQILKGAGI